MASSHALSSQSVGQAVGQSVSARKSSPSMAAFVLRLPDHQKELHQFIWQLFDDGMHTDCEISLDDGQYIRAHKLILSAFSPYFRQVLCRLSAAHHSAHHYPIIIVKDVKYEDLRSLVEFMYRGQVTVADDRLPQVLKCAKQLKVRGLYESNNINNYGHHHANYDYPQRTELRTMPPMTTPVAENMERCNKIVCNNNIPLHNGVENVKIVENQIETRKPKVEIPFEERVNSNACEVKNDYVTQWLTKKLNPPHISNPNITNIHQKIALDLSKRMVMSEQCLLGPTAQYCVPPGLFRSTSVDDSQLTANLMENGAKRKAASSLDGHLDGNNNGDDVSLENGDDCNKDKKRNLNIFHAAKYRNRKKQQLDALFQEEVALQKQTIMSKVQIEKLESTILTLIWQQTKRSLDSSQTVFACPVCGNVQKEVARLRSHINMLHNDTEALMKFLMLQRSPTTPIISSTMPSSTASVPFQVKSE